MAVHDLLRELVETRGAGVVGDADQFRGALDDFLDEHEATRGEINLLVDAVRLGAVNRVVTMLDHGADPGAAIAEVAVELARDRGADSATGARWALGVIGYALGKVPADLLGADRPSSVPAPAQRPITASPPPSVPDLSTEPTDPPSHPSFPRPESEPAPPPPPEPERVPAAPTNVAGEPPERPGTITLPEHATERVPDDSPPAPPAGHAAPPPYSPAPPPSAPVKKGRGRLIAVLAALLLVIGAGAVGAVLLVGDDGGDDTNRTASDPNSQDASPSEDSGGGTETGSGPPVEPVPDGTLLASQLVLPVTVEGDTSLYVVDTGDGAVTRLSQGVDDRLPTISPDRATVAFLRPQTRGTGVREPYLLDLATGEERRLFTEDSPCVYSSPPVWAAAGDRLAVSCVDEAGDPVGTFVVGLDGQQIQQLALDGVPCGLSWVSESVIVYCRADTDDGPTTLWVHDLGGGTSEPVTDGSAGYDSHPDWSEDNGVVLFQRSTDGDPDARGTLWTYSQYEGEAELVVGRAVSHPAWSVDGSQVAFVVETDDGERLATASGSEPGDLTIHDSVPGEPGAPAWGSR